MPRDTSAAAGSAADGGEGAFALERIALGAAAQLSAGVAPDPMFGVALRALLALHGDGIWAPAVQLAASRVWVGELEQPGGVADFQLTALRLELCPLGLRGGGLRARACAGGGLGSLTAQGARSYSPRSSARLWADLGAGLTGSADLPGPFVIQAGAGLGVPLRRDRFAFRPEIFHRVAAICWDAHLGLGVRFP